MNLKRILMAPVDGASGGGTGGGDGKGADGKGGKTEKTGDGGGDDGAKAAAAKLAQVEAENAKLKKQADDAAKKESDAAARAAAKKAAEDGKLEDTLTDIQKRLKDSEAERERLIASAKLRAEAQVAKMADADKAFLMKLQPKMSFTDWQEAVEERAAAITTTTTPKKDEGTGGTTVVPPSTGGPRSGNNTGGYHEPTDKASQILDGLGRSDAVLRRIKMEQDQASGAWKFFKPVREFFEEMPRKAISRLTAEEAAKRRIRSDNKTTQK